MLEENIAVNPEKLAVDERVDKLEATMQTLAATLKAISLTLSTLTTSSAPSLASLIPTIPVPPVPTITPGSRAKDPMVTQLQFPPISENQPLMGESSSHAPQISSLPFETSYPPLEMNNPTLNVPPLMGQATAIQPNPLVEILRPTLEDGKLREVDHKLQQLEEALKAMQGPQAYGCPYAHLKMYARKMAPYANDERDVSQAFMRQYEYNMSLAPTRDSLQRITKKGNETFKEFAQQWRSEAAKVIPPLADSEICFLFIKSTTKTFHAWLAPCVGYTFAQLVIAGEQIEDGLKTSIITDFQTIKRQLEQVKTGNAESTSRKFTPKGKKEDDEALSHIFISHAKPIYNVANVPYNRQPQLQFTPTFKPTTYPQRRPNFNTQAPVRQQFPLTNRPRQFTRLPIPYSEVLKQLLGVGLMKTVQAAPIRPPYPDWYDQQVRCEYHNVVGHDTKYCTTLKHRVQDLIDEGKLQLDTKETKGAPNITQNPLPPHGAPTMNMVAFDEVDRPVLENANSWSFDELFAILIEHDLIQTIALVSSDVPLVTIDDALVCLYHCNMKGHTLQNCGDFQRKIMELQRMGSLKFMSAPESEKFIASVTEEYFTKEKPYILQDTTKAQVISQPYVLKTSLSELLMGKTSSVARPQRSTILNSTANDVSNMTRSGQCYVSPKVEESRRTALKSKGIRIEEILEESPKKLVSKNEVAEFLNILGRVHLDALLKVLKEAHVPKNIDTQKFGTMVGAILAPNYINFTDDEILDEGNGHTKALHISVQCKMMNVPHVLIDNGLALNVIPMTVLKQLKVDESHINRCNIVVHAFDGTKRNVIGKIELPMEIGPVTFDVDFFVMDISPAFNMLLGRPWIHVAGAVPSTLHQKVKYIVNGVLVTVNGDEEHIIRKATTIPYLGVDPGTYEVVAKIMLACHYQLGKGLGLNGQGILEPIEVIQAGGTFGLGYKPKKEDWQRMRAIKAEKRFARLQGRDPRDEPVWVPHIRVTFPRPVEILCPSFDGYMYEEAVVEDITDEVCSDDEEDGFGFNNLFEPAKMTDPKERWRRMLFERAFMEKHPNFHLVQASMGTHESVLLEIVKEESLCDSWGNLTINALDEEKLEFDRGISLVNGNSQKDMPGLDPDITIHAIPLYYEAKLVKQKLRRMKPEVLLKVKEEVQKLLDVNFIEVAMYPEWVANIVPVMKKDGRVRVCVDYRDLNKASPKDDFPLPHIQIMLDNAAKNTRFFFVDGYFGYNQIRMKEEDKLKTTFITQWGTFCYKVMPFGLKNAGATYQRFVIALLHDFVHTIVELYVDDMVIMSKEEVLHTENLKKVFERLRKYQLRLNPTKCTFDVDFGKLLGFIVSCRGIEIDPAKIKAIDEMPPPKTQKEAIKGQAIADHLAEHATEDYEPIDWDFPDEDILALEAESDSDNWKLFFDGAVNQLGCGLGALLVSPKGDHFLIAIKLDFACTNNIAEYEACIAGIHAALDMNVRDLEIYGDSALIICQTNGDWQTKDPKLIPYHQYLETLIKKFRFISLNHMPRAKNQFADALATLASMIQISSDDVIKPLMIEISQELAHCMEIKVDDNHGFMILNNSCKMGNTLYMLLRCVDETEAKQVMIEVHEGICGTHANGRMLARKILRAGYYWLTMEHDCIKYARACHKCQIYVDHINAPPSLLHNMSAPWPFSMWGIDVIRAINPKASNGHQFILVAIDYFTKWIEAASYASVTKKVITRFIKREIICRYGQPEAIITDNASNLNNDMMTALCKQFKIKHLNSSPYRPKMNGAVEAANNNIKKILAKMAVTYKDWHEMLPYALHAYRTSVRTSTGQHLIPWYMEWRQYYQLS
ncbi:hypothetical protein SLEP1_g3641 [Rubroshorea leprosula]|uniref:Uncharacterized protein n=1 Tax=Rubroshorea leprosula TaxID=152421 RepID=A0AAV5HL30_9ROSI|nr:hypothetical protein SLEP1_g3641 [Rubroshorea leprosula]